MRQTPQQRMAEYVQRLEEQRAPVVELLNSPAGQVLLREMEKLFIFGPLLGDTPEETAFNLGAREVVMRLRSLRDNQGQEKKPHGLERKSRRGTSQR